ncbi:MAG: AAA family ATPase [Bacteroidales bacterium]|nr:AAA family ATPase [Bacteroidales bacterium]
MDDARSVIKESMIIKEIHIDGFGIFHDYSLKGLKEGVNIITGNNEAGKSTMLKFLRYTLFGYPRYRDQRMQPVHGGSHGGRIIAITSANKDLILERNGNDQISLYHEGQNSQNESLWLQLLGNANKDIFENVYAFSLDELTDIKSLSASGVEDRIFSMGMGLGNISLTDVEDVIQKSIDAVYTPRGSKQEIPAILGGIQERKRQLLEIQNNLPAYSNLASRIKELEYEITDLGTKFKGYQSRKEQLDQFLKCYESFVIIVKTEELLKTLPELQDYPVDGLTRLSELELEEKSLRKKIQELQNGNEDAAGIEELHEEIDSISFNDKLLSSSDVVEYLRTNLELYKQTVREKAEHDGKIESIDQLVRQELLRINADWSEQNLEEFTGEISHRDRIRDFKTEFNNIDNNKRDLEAQLKILQSKESPVNANNIMILIAVIFILGAAPLFYYTFYILGGICLITAILLFFSRKYIIRESLQDHIKEQLSDIDEKLNEVKSRFGEYLEKNLGLEQTLSTDAALEILDTVKHLKKDIGERNELKIKRAEQWIPFINTFEEKVGHVQRISGIHTAEDNMEVLVNQLIQLSDFTAKQLRRKEELQNILSARQKELEKTQKQLNDNEKIIKQLLKSIHAKDKDDFRKKYDENKQAKELTEMRRNAVVTIETIAGLNRSREVIDFLSTHKQLDIKEESQKLEKEIGEMREALDDRIREMGEKRGEIKRIEGESELAQVMTELETERQKLNNAYREWITGKIALKILSEAKETYEREKQPAVIKNSGTYFSKITSGRYNRIKISLGEKDITVFDSREALKKIDQLSRGTREQLLISLRLGFIEEYETKAEPLPVIVDEVLVNFDPVRARKAAGIFQEFGENRQILVFTCHPSTPEYFNRTKINLLILDHQ